MIVCIGYEERICVIIDRTLLIQEQSFYIFLKRFVLIEERIDERTSSEYGIKGNFIHDGLVAIKGGGFKIVQFFNIDLFCESSNERISFRQKFIHHIDFRSTKDKIQVVREIVEYILEMAVNRIRMISFFQIRIFIDDDCLFSIETVQVFEDRFEIVKRNIGRKRKNLA